MYNLLRTALVIGLLVFAAQVPASDNTAVGTWRTIDDETGKPKAVVEINENDGVLAGKVIKVLQSDQGPHPLCKECAGERHNQPVEGMTILWGLERDGDEWNGGHILDPSNGKIYKAKMSLGENGQTLNVRAYIGFSLLGRTQTWERVEKPMPAASSSIAPLAPVWTSTVPALEISNPASTSSTAEPAAPSGV